MDAALETLNEPMKAIAALMIMPLVALAAPREVARGQGSNNSSPYTTAGAYHLTWEASFPSKDVEWITLMVMEADTQRMVASATTQPKAGKLFVPQGGRHFLQVISAADAWKFSAEELPPGSVPRVIAGKVEYVQNPKPVDLVLLEARQARLELALRRMERDMAEAPTTQSAVDELQRRAKELEAEATAIKRDGRDAVKRHAGWIRAQRESETKLFALLGEALKEEQAKALPGLPPGVVPSTKTELPPGMERK